MRRGKRDWDEPMPQNDGLELYWQRTRQPFVVNENLKQRWIEIGMEWDDFIKLKSYLAVPLFVGDELVAGISLQNEERENAFSELDVRLLQTLANSMSVALENARLFDETQRLLKETEQRAAELQIINSVQLGLASKLDIQAIYDLVGDEIRNIFDAQVVLIATLDPVNQMEEFNHNIEKGQRFYTAPRRYDRVRQYLVDSRQPYLNNRITVEQI